MHKSKSPSRQYFPLTWSTPDTTPEMQQSGTTCNIGDHDKLGKLRVSEFRSKLEQPEELRAHIRLLDM